MSTSTATASDSATAATNAGWRTLTFAGVAVACLAITAVVEYTNRPEPIEEFGRIGEQFFPDFVDPTLASALEVYAFDAEEVRPQEFIVRRGENGRWTIPSHHDYPADAEDQLAKTAASVIGIERGAMVTRWEADHAGYGVVNPRQDSLGVDEVDGVGKRLILRGEGDVVLADYIIGKQPDEDRSDEYYVRRSDEDEVYIASLDIDLSTKFADWIDTDLLHVNQTDILQLTINDYSIDEIQGTVSQTETSILKREKPADDWMLEGLNEETEEVDKDALRDAVYAIADMKIVGVREKQEGLTPELTLDRSAIASQNDFNQMRADLARSGFHLQSGEQPESFKLLATEGELFASADDGLIYRMYFGRAFSGSQEELEIGLNSDDSTGEESAGDTDTEEPAEEDAENESSAGDDDAAEESADADGESNDDDTEDKKQPGRYVFVKVDFDESLLSERPVEPVEPEMPEELKQAQQEGADESSTDADSDETDGGDDQEADATETEDGADNAANGDTEETEEDPLAEIREAWETARKEYEARMAAYDVDLKEFEQKIEDGKKKAEELNRRFAEWYYVVPGETFDKLRLSRQDIVKAREQDEEDTEATDADPLQLNTDTTDGSSDTTTSPEPQPATDTDDASGSDPAQQPEPAADSSESSRETPTTEEKPEASPSDEPSPDESTPDESSPDDSDTEPPQDTPADPEPPEDSE